MKNIWYWILFVILCIWQLPQFIVSITMIPFLGKLTVVANRHHNICFKGYWMSGGISLGPFSFVSEKLAKRETTISHEVDGHTKQSLILGPLYLIVIGLPSLLNAWFDFTKCYYDFYTEKWANDCANLGVDEYCSLYFKKDKENRNKFTYCLDKNYNANKKS